MKRYRMPFHEAREIDEVFWKDNRDFNARRRVLEYLKNKVTRIVCRGWYAMLFNKRNEYICPAPPEDGITGMLASFAEEVICDCRYCEFCALEAAYLDKPAPVIFEPDEEDVAV